MDWHAVLELVVTVVFLAGIALALLCLVTIHRNPHFSEVQKLKWLLLVLCLPYVGPVTWLLRARLERIDRERAETSVWRGSGVLQLHPMECPIAPRRLFRTLHHL